MVTLKNICRTADFISAEYYPETSQTPGFIKLSNDGTVIERRLTEYDGYLKSYFVHARNRLQKYLEENRVDFLEEVTIMWC